MKKRILNERLASIISSLRHGEMIFIADAGSGSTSKSLYPLDPNVEYLNLGVVTGSPSFKEVIDTLIDVGDFELAIITNDMPKVNKEDYSFLVNKLGKDNIIQSNYIPEYYELRDRCKAMIQTGDYSPHAQAILVAGYSTSKIPMDWLVNGLKKA